MSTVLKEWVMALPLKEQSRLLSALRGPDQAFCPNLKRVVKIIRATAQHDADPESDYMRIKRIEWKELEREIEFCSLHYVSHLIEAMETIARLSLDPLADQFLDWFADTFHLRYESDAEQERNWAGGRRCRAERRQVERLRGANGSARRGAGERQAPHRTWRRRHGSLPNLRPSMVAPRSRTQAA